MVLVHGLWEMFTSGDLGPLGLGFAFFFFFFFFFGIMVGWAWKPRWAEMWLSNIDKIMDLGSGYIHRNVVHKNLSCRSTMDKKEENHLVTDEDLKHLWRLVESKDEGPSWKHMMDRSIATMHYQAWQRDPETSPPQYCSKTVYENATPELMRDFFWDDEFRLKWDNMLIHVATLHEFPITGTSIAHWIRKFPFFCSDREYMIACHIWELGRSYYCVTKGVPCDLVLRQQKPKRIDHYYSSWFIRPVKSKIGSDQAAYEVTFFHHEDMGIPWEIAKFGVRQGMWKAAKKVEHGFRLYQKERAFSKMVSVHVIMAQKSTKLDKNHLDSLESDEVKDMIDTQEVSQQEKQTMRIKVPKILVFSVAVMVACSIDCGLLSKTIIFGVAKRFAFVGKQAYPNETIDSS